MIQWYTIRNSTGLREQGIQQHPFQTQGRVPGDLGSHLQDHLSPGHALHHYLGVAGGGLAEDLGADGGQVQKDGLQRVGVQKQLVAGSIQMAYGYGMFLLLDILR